MRNTILALVAAGSLTVGTLSPAFAGLECSDYPNLDKCPVYGGAETPRPSAYQVPPRAVRHAHNYHGSYHYHY